MIARQISVVPVVASTNASTIVAFIVLLVFKLVSFRLDKLTFANRVIVSVNGTGSIGIVVISRRGFLVLVLAV